MRILTGSVLFCTDLLVRELHNSGMEPYISPAGVESPEPLVEFANLVYFYRILRQVSERPAELPVNAASRNSCLQ
jgi:hypothetical protein